MPTAAQRERTQMRTKLYTGHMIPMGGRGGAPIPESSADASRPGLIQMWPIYLGMELAAAKPTLSLPDVAAMMELQQAPAFHALAARQLSENELATALGLAVPRRSRQSSSVPPSPRRKVAS